MVEADIAAKLFAAKQQFAQAGSIEQAAPSTPVEPSETQLTPFQNSVARLAVGVGVNTLDGMETFIPLLETQAGDPVDQTTIVDSLHDIASALSEYAQGQNYTLELGPYIEVVLNMFPKLDRVGQEEMSAEVVSMINSFSTLNNSYTVPALAQWIEGLDQLHASTASAKEAAIYHVVSFNTRNESVDVRATTYKPEIVGFISEENMGGIQQFTQVDGFEGKRPILYFDNEKSAVTLGFSPTESFVPEAEPRGHTLAEQLTEIEFLLRVKTPENIDVALTQQGEIDWDSVRDYVWTLKEALLNQGIDGVKGPHEEVINIITRLSKSLPEEDRGKLDDLVEDFVYDYADIDRVQAADDHIHWKQGVYQNGNGHEDGDAGEAHLASQQPGGPKFVKGILLILQDYDLDNVGQYMIHSLRSTYVSRPKVTFEEIRQEFGDQSETGGPVYPERVLRQIVQCFIETGYLRYNQRSDSYEFTQAGKQTQKLGGDEVSMISWANDVITGEPEVEHVKDYGEVIQHYEDYWRENALPKVEVTMDKDRVRPLYIADALHGKAMFDPKLLKRFLDYIDKLSPDEQPDMYVLSGLVEGEHKFVRKNHRAELAGNVMRHLTAQLESAKMIVDRLKSKGKPVIYSLSTEDFEECYNQTAETVRNLRNMDNQFRKNNRAFINYWQLDQLRTLDSWDRIFRFYVDVAYPYMLRSGRSLMDANEVTTASGGKIRVPEFLLLYNAHQRLSKGEKIPSRWSAILNENYITYPGKPTKDDYVITNGMDLNITTQGQVYTTRFKHNFADFTDITQKRPNIDAMKEDIEHSLATEGTAPDAEWDAHHDIFFAQAVAEAENGGLHWAGWLPSPLRTQQTKESLDWNVRGKKERNQRLRRDIPTPAMITMEQRDDGVVAFDVMTEKFNDKSTISPNRTAVITLNDFQVGSITALVDYSATLADIAFKEIAQNHKVVIVVNGDAIQGNIYKGMANENFATGLLPIDNQVKLVEDILKLTFAGMTQQQKDNIVVVGSTAGNHETRSWSDFTGAMYIAWQRQLFQKLFNDDNPNRVKEFKAFETPQGAFIRGSVGFEENLAGSGYGGIFMHEVKDTKGKGGEPGAAVLATKQMNNAHALLYRPYDFSFHGHWHNEQLTLNNDKLGIIAASMAAPSWYEYTKALQSHAGLTVTYMGGHLPVRVEFWPKKTLAKHKITSGPLNDEALADEGFHTDEGFDPLVHGFAIPPMLDDGRPASALQKKLWNTIWHNAFERQVLLGPKKG